MIQENSEFWNGMGKGVDLSLEVLSDELKIAEESVKPVISKLIGQLMMQKNKIEIIKS